MDQTGAELRELNVDLAARISARNEAIDARMRDRERGPPPSEAPAAAPLLDDGIDPAPSEALFAEYNDPAIGLVAESNALILGLIEDVRRSFERKIAGLENAHAKLVNENSALRLILENLRVTQRGERGIDGDRGPPGRDGRDGEGKIGPQGPAGPKGAAAPRIAAWEIDDSGFVAYPVLSNGHKGPGLHLRGMFETYNQQVEASDIAAETDLAVGSRAATEREAANVRAGRPAR